MLSPHRFIENYIAPWMRASSSETNDHDPIDTPVPRRAPCICPFERSWTELSVWRGVARGLGGRFWRSDRGHTRLVGGWHVATGKRRRRPCHRHRRPGIAAEAGATHRTARGAEDRRDAVSAR